MQAAAETAIQHYGALPYTKATNAHGAGAFIPSSGGAIGRALRGLTGLFKSPSTERNFAFDTEAGVAFFVTNSAALQTFGYRHGDRLRYGEGVLAGKSCTVIGLRGGALWVANDLIEGDSVASGLFAVPLSGITRAELDDCYRFTKMISLTEVRQSDAAKEFLSVTSRRVLNFLQFAPDLEIEVAEFEGARTLAESSSHETIRVLLSPVLQDGAAGWGAAESRFNVTGTNAGDTVSEVGIFVGCQAFFQDENGLIADCESSSDEEEEKSASNATEEDAADAEE